MCHGNPCKEGTLCQWIFSSSHPQFPYCQALWKVLCDSVDPHIRAQMHPSLMLFPQVYLRTVELHQFHCQRIFHSHKALWQDELLTEFKSNKGSLQIYRKLYH